MNFSCSSAKSQERPNGPKAYLHTHGGDSSAQYLSLNTAIMDAQGGDQGAASSLLLPRETTSRITARLFTGMDNTIEVVSYRQTFLQEVY